MKHIGDKHSSLMVSAVLLANQDYSTGAGQAVDHERQVSVTSLLAELDRRGWLHYFQHVQAAQLGVAGYWWLASPNLAAVLIQDVAVLRSWIPGLSVVVNQSSVVSMSFQHPASRVAVFASLLFWLLVRQAQGSRSKLTLLTLDRSFETDDYLSVFSQECKFVDSGEQACICFPQTVLSTPFSTANSTLLPLFSDCVPFLRQKHPTDLTAQIYCLLEGASELSHVNPNWIAGKLAISERTLNRQLADLEITFRELLTRFRNSQAITRLCDGESIDRLTDYLGFSERAAFERAFKSWQGVTPAKFQFQYRRLSKDVDIEALISLDKLPSMPAIGVQLLDLAQRDDASLEDMASLVEQDPVLTAKLISIASSAFYGMKSGSSIKEIVVRVFGVDKLRSLALAVLAAGCFRLHHCPAFSLERFWMLSLGAAQLASDCYRKSSKPVEEQADIYLAGLLHNIGRLVLVQIYPNKMQALLEPLLRYPAPQELLAMEKLRLGVDSSEAGALLLARWQLPRSVSVVMRQLAVDKVAMMPEASLLLLAEEFLIAHIESSSGVLEADQQAAFVNEFALLLNLPNEAVNEVLSGFAGKMTNLQAMAAHIIQR